MDPPTEQGTAFGRTSRLGFLKRVGAVGVATTAAGTLGSPAPAAVAEAEIVEREGAGGLTATDLQTVEAIVARLIPTDANGPGATEARVARYIDWSLAGGLAFFRDSYERGLTQLDAYCRSVNGAPFAQMTAAQQDAVLTNMQANTATGFTPDAQTFFNLIRGHAVQGMFGDPFHGGNANLVGWDLIGFPGIKIAGVTARDQSLDYAPTSTRKTAYDSALFKKLKPRDKAAVGAMKHGH
jgi:gluconate 2-dehydrogenase gamma chain